MTRVPNAEPDANNCWYGTEHCTLPHCDCVKRSNSRYRTDERLRSMAAEARRGSEQGWDVIGITDAVELAEELIVTRAENAKFRQALHGIWSTGCDVFFSAPGKPFSDAMDSVEKALGYSTRVRSASTPSDEA